MKKVLFFGSHIYIAAEIYCQHPHNLIQLLYQYSCACCMLVAPLVIAAVLALVVVKTRFMEKPDAKFLFTFTYFAIIAITFYGEHLAS